MTGRDCFVGRAEGVADGGAGQGFQVAVRRCPIRVKRNFPEQTEGLDIPKEIEICLNECNKLKFNQSSLLFMR